MKDSHSTDLTILLYHGVTNEVEQPIRNYSGKHIKVETFERHMKTLSEECNVMSMDEVALQLQSGDGWPNKAVAITFDDGFENNFLNAVPILKKFKIPATFYVCSGMVDTELMFWVDQIEDCIALTECENLQLDSIKHDKFLLNTIENKIAAIEVIKRFCKNQITVEKNKIIDELIHKTNVHPAVSSCPDYKMMSWKQLRLIASEELFIVGGHTLYHDIMAAQSHQKLELDISTSISLLDYNLDQTTKHYAYPEGQPQHYNDHVINILKKYGIKMSPSAIHGTNNAQNPFHLKRIMPGFMGTEFPF